MPGSTSDEVAKIIEKTFQALTTAKAAVAPVAGEPGPRILFPNGVELLYFETRHREGHRRDDRNCGEKASIRAANTERSAAVGSDGTSVSI